MRINLVCCQVTLFEGFSFFFSSLEVFWFCGNCYHYYTTSLNEAWTKALRRFKSYLRCAGDSRWWGSLTMVLAVNKSKCLSPVNHTTKTIHHHHHLILSGFSFPQLLHRLLSNFWSFLLPELLHYEVFLIFIFFSFSLTRMKLLRCFFIVSQISCYQN